MLKENHNLKEALEEYIQLLNKNEFFDAHEVLEEAWHPLRKAKHPQRNLVKGLINASIAFEHIKRDKEEAQRKAHTVFKSYLKYKSLSTKRIEYYPLFSKAIEKVEVLRAMYL